MPTGRIPYAGRSINSTAYDRTLLEMMQRQSEQDQQYRREERQRQQEQWGQLASLPARLYETYRGVKDQQRARALQEQADKAAHGMTLLQSLQGAPQSIIDSAIGSQIQPVTYEDGVIKGGIESIPPYESEVHPAAASRIIPPVTPGVEGGPPGGGVESMTPSLPGGELPMRTKRPPHVLQVPQPFLDAEGNPFPTIPYELVSREKQDRAALDLRQQAQQDIVDTEARKLVADKDLLRTEAGIAGSFQREASRLRREETKQRFGFELANLKQGNEWDEESWLRRTQQTHVNNLIESGEKHLDAIRQAERGSTLIPQGVERTIIGEDGKPRTVKVLASRANSDGSTIINLDPAGDYYVLASVEKEEDVSPWVQAVDKETGEVTSFRMKNGVQEISKFPGVVSSQVYRDRLKESSKTDAFEFVRDLYETQNEYRVPRDASTNPSLQDVLDKKADFFTRHSISGWGTKPMSVWNEMWDVNPEALKLKEDINAASNNFYTVAANYGNYRRSLMSLKILEEKLGTLEGGFFTGSQKLQSRANSWMELVDDIVRSAAQEVSMELNSTGERNRASFRNLLGAAQRLEHVLGLTNRPPIIAEYFSVGDRGGMTPDPLIPDLRGGNLSDEDLDALRGTGGH